MHYPTERVAHTMAFVIQVMAGTKDIADLGPL